MSKQIKNNVRDYYNEHVKEEDERLNKHSFEIPVTLSFINRYLKPGDKIFDVACGTGRIARELLDEGYLLGLNDLSDKNIELVKKRLQGRQNVLFIENNDALERNGWGKTQWDGILILGPLYHIISREKRLKVLELAYQHVKPGGYVFSSYMTRIGAMVYGVKKKPDGILHKNGVKKLWETGTDDRFVGATEWFVNAYFAHPEEVNPLIKKAGLTPIHLAGAEGIFGERFELYHQMEEKLKKPWMDFIIEHCEDPRMVCQAKHLLSVARKTK
ncbi:MAG: class I SAM-dependent methyltransferase [Bacteroidales bacterium]